MDIRFGGFPFFYGRSGEPIIVSAMGIVSEFEAVVVETFAQFGYFYAFHRYDRRYVDVYKAAPGHRNFRQDSEEVEYEFGSQIVDLSVIFSGTDGNAWKP